MIERMFDLAIKPLTDGAFELSQLAGSLDEPATIMLHRAQVRVLAERAGLIDRPLPALPRIRRDLERIRAKAADLHVFLACVPSFPPQPEEDEDVTLARELVEALDDLLADIGDAQGEQCNVTLPLQVTPRPSLSESAAQCNKKKSAAISVTPEGISVTQKRGRPKKQDALTNAERQRAHRAKQAEPATAHPDLLTESTTNRGALQ